MLTYGYVNGIHIYIYGNIDRAEVGLEPTIFRL